LMLLIAERLNRIIDHIEQLEQRVKEGNI
jgi:hypothetical protein